MTTTLWYTKDVPVRRRKREHTMSPTTETTTKKANPVTRTVFDLAKFDSVKLEKPFSDPEKPANLEAALAAVGNDQSKLLDVIHAGLVSHARDAAYNDIAGFYVVDEDDNTTETLYSGQFADETVSKKINGAVLGLAKALGYEKSLPKEKKAALKDQAISFIRSNPAMLAQITGTPAPAQ
jgi:hypothetical protein